MGKLAPLRLVRMTGAHTVGTEHPSLEALVEAEFSKVSDGYHLARWVVPLCGLGVGAGVFIPLTLFVHPLFVIGAAGLSAIGLILGAVFHHLARKISPTELGLRKKCAMLGQRMVGLSNLFGVSPALSPNVAAILEEAASALMSVRPLEGESRSPASRGVFADASLKAENAMIEAMTKLLSLADSPSLHAQEAELARGWAQPLLEEMKATAAVLANPSPRVQIAAEIEASTSPLAGLVDARAQLERLEQAASELDSGQINEQA